MRDASRSRAPDRVQVRASFSRGGKVACSFRLPPEVIESLRQHVAHAQAQGHLVTMDAALALAIDAVNKAIVARYGPPDPEARLKLNRRGLTRPRPVRAADIELPATDITVDLGDTEGKKR